MTAATAHGETGASLGEVELHVPKDWFDLLEDGFDDESARSRIAELMRMSYPGRNIDLLKDFTEAVMAWRRGLLAQGTLMHGIVCVPPGQDDEVAAGAAWQVMAGVVDVPHSVAELDMGEVIARLMGDEFSGMETYTKAYGTAMGLGVGCVARPYITAVGDMMAKAELATGSAAVQIGLGIALSCRPGGGRGLLVVGTCLDPEQTAALGTLVAVIAGGSMIHTDGQPTEAV